MKLFFSVALFFIYATIFSQNILKGTIKDSSTKEILPFASIYLPQLEKGAVTDDNGIFSINNLPSGNYKVVISILGYKTISKNIDLPYTGSMNITLSPSALEMEEVIVSTPFNKLQSQNVMKVERESLSKLKEKGAVTLSDGITNIPGVESVTTGVSIGKPVIRGLSHNRVLVYTQGVRLENQQFGDEHGLGVSADGIESVEVIKGPASLLYGSDALGGVLYLNPERFANANTSSGDFGASYYSNTLGYDANMGYKTSGDKFKFLLRASQAEHSDYKTKDYRVTDTRFKEQDLKAGAGYQNGKFKTELRYNINYLKPGIPEGLGEQSTSKSTIYPYQKVTNHVLSSKSTVFFNNSSLDVNLGYLYNIRKELEDNPKPSLYLKLKTVNYDVKYNLPKMGKFETIVGLQGMNQSNSNHGEEELIPDATTNDVGILAVSHVHFKKAEVQLGARFDNRNIDVKNGITPSFNSFNGAVGVKTNLVQHLSLRLNLATGFRAPNLAELTSNGVHEGTNRYEKGNPNLTNEQNFQADLDLEFKTSHVDAYAMTFYNKINNYIYISPNGNVIDNNPVYNYLQNNAKLYGGEFGIHFHPHPLDWLHVESSFETVTGKQGNGSYLPLIPANSINNTLRINFKDDWVKKGYIFVKLQSTFKQNNIGSFETSSKSYNLLSAGLGGKVPFFKKYLNLSIAGSNLTNKRYINHLSRLKTDGIYNIGRNIVLSLKYKI